ncbi:MAG: hypothetical protein ACU0GG_03695 [Paracoccaceae bacterium]
MTKPAVTTLTPAPCQAKEAAPTHLKVVPSASTAKRDSEPARRTSVSAAQAAADYDPDDLWDNVPI